MTRQGGLPGDFQSLPWFLLFFFLVSSPFPENSRPKLAVLETVDFLPESRIWMGANDATQPRRQRLPALLGWEGPHWLDLVFVSSLISNVATSAVISSCSRSSLLCSRTPVLDLGFQLVPLNVPYPFFFFFFRTITWC